MQYVEYKSGDKVVRTHRSCPELGVEIGEVYTIKDVLAHSTITLEECWKEGTQYHYTFDLKNFKPYVEETQHKVLDCKDLFDKIRSGEVELDCSEMNEETPKQPVKSAGVKYDEDKLEPSLLPKGVLNSVLKVLGFGAKKYAKDNWMKVPNHKERYYNAMQRHITQWWEGEKYDSETGENHLAHAICCAMFLLWFDNQDNKGEVK